MGASVAAGEQPRAARRALRRAWRPQRIWPALIVAVLIAALTITIAVSAISTLAGHPVHAVPPSRIIEPLTTTSWQDLAARVAAAALVLAGLVCLLLACKPGRPRAVPMACDAPGTALALTYPALAAALAATAGDLDGVDRAKVRVRARRVKIRAYTPLRDPGSLATDVREHVRRRVTELEPARPPRVTVRIRRKNT